MKKKEREWSRGKWTEWKRNEWNEKEGKGVKQREMERKKKKWMRGKWNEKEGKGVKQREMERRKKKWKRGKVIEKEGKGREEMERSQRGKRYNTEITQPPIPHYPHLSRVSFSFLYAHVARAAQGILMINMAPRPPGLLKGYSMISLITCNVLNVHCGSIDLNPADHMIAVV